MKLPTRKFQDQPLKFIKPEMVTIVLRIQLQTESRKNSIKTLGSVLLSLALLMLCLACVDEKNSTLMDRKKPEITVLNNKSIQPQYVDCNMIGDIGIIECTLN